MRFRTHREEGPTVLSVSRVRPGVFGKRRWKLLPMSVAWVAAEMMVPCAVLVELGRNKASLHTPPDVFLERGCQSRRM